MTRNRMQFYARIDYIASKFDLGIALNAWDNMISQFLILLIKVPKKLRYEVRTNTPENNKIGQKEQKARQHNFHKKVKEKK